MEATERKSKPALMPANLGLADAKRQDWVADIPVGVTVEQAMDPSYWAHVAELMVPLDSVELRAEDGTWVAEAIVQFCERNYARLVMKQFLKLDQAVDAPSASEQHRVDWKGPVLKWCVIRNSDNKIVREGVRSKELANVERTDHERTMSR